mmetsp:Transcript_5974/g.7807  ORF Transcript_5974/g.7807 Transcript_5974/m.7807 type:complete len:192 (+) Transcript_5974:77-652(+)
MLLVDHWPDALMEKTNYGYSPLHVATRKKAPLEVVAFLIDCHPDSLKMKTNHGHTPLHLACRSQAPLEVVLLLLERMPEVMMERCNHGETPMDIARLTNEPNDARKLVSLASSLYKGEMNNPLAEESIGLFTKIQWWYGIAWVLNEHPAVAQNINVHIKIIPNFLSMVGRSCNKKTLWHILCNKQDLFKDI